VQVNEILNITIISREKPRNKRLLNWKISLILAKFKIKMRKKSNICLVHAIERNSVLTHLSRYHNDRLTITSSVWGKEMLSTEGENSVDGRDVGTRQIYSLEGT